MLANKTMEQENASWSHSLEIEKIKKLIKQNDWSALDKTVVIFYKENPISFSCNKWKYTYGKGSIIFTQKDVLITLKLQRQLKLFAFFLLYISVRTYSWKTILSYVSSLRLLFTKYLIPDGIKNLEQVKKQSLLKALNKLVKDGSDSKKTVQAINCALRIIELFPYPILPGVEYIKAKDLKLSCVESLQTPVPPYRIYIHVLRQYSQDITYWYKYRNKINTTVAKALDSHRKRIHRLGEALRYGKRSLTSVVKNKKVAKQVEKSFEENKIKLVDYGQDKNWWNLFNSLEPSINSTISKKSIARLDFTPIKIGSKEINRPSQIFKLISELRHKAVWLCLALSGIREHEFGLIDLIYGAQFVYAGPEGRKTPVFTTLTTKIKESSQVKKRVFVTTETGHKAFKILNSIMEPYRKYLTKPDSSKMWVRFGNPNYQKPVNSVEDMIADIIKSGFSRYNSNTTKLLTEEDLMSLHRSDPTNKSFRIGHEWKMKAHQLRRALPYYLVGLELAGFVQLKEQYGHLSLKMAMYYGRNAENFSTFYKELEAERVEQQSERMADIFKRIANKDRVAGGKGKKMLKELKNGKFKKSDIERKCSKHFWHEELIKRKNELRVHVVAPGIICTNAACDMRIEIDLSECVDCEFTFIEHAAFAEQTRQASMYKLAHIEFENEVIPDAVAREMIRIKSAEQIMNDLGIPYDVYTPSTFIKKQLIDIQIKENNNDIEISKKESY